MRFDRERLPHYALHFVGSVSVVLAGVGLWHNMSLLSAPVLPEPGMLYLPHAFYAMSAICIACYLALLLIGVQFIRLRTSWFKPFVWLIVFEVVYFFGIGMYLSDTNWFGSVWTRVAVAHGAMSFQLITLFVLWGPLLARWATKRIDTPEDSDSSPYPRQEVARGSDWVWGAVSFVVVYLMLSVLGAYIPRQILSSGSAIGLALLLSMTNAILTVRQRRRWRRRILERRRADRLSRGLCPRCGYNLTGNVSGVCPECGERI